MDKEFYPLLFELLSQYLNPNPEKPPTAFVLLTLDFDQPSSSEAHNGQMLSNAGANPEIIHDMLKDALADIQREIVERARADIEGVLDP